MRSRKEIEQKAIELLRNGGKGAMEAAIVEILLDIRDLLQANPPHHETKEE